MNKTDLINKLADRLDGDKKAAQKAVEGFIDLVQREVQRGQKVSISGFGVFEKRARAARTARNPRTGEAVKVKKTNVPSFRAGTAFKDIVSGKLKLPKAGSGITTARALTAAAKAGGTSTRRSTAAKAAPAAKPATRRSTAAKAAPAAKPATRRSTAAKAAPAAKPATRRSTAAKAAPAAKPATRRSTAAKAAPAVKPAAKRTAAPKAAKPAARRTAATNK